jgi:murein DD-endopeptidase MepM/ murein hydrolase activator NlpD
MRRFRLSLRLVLVTAVALGLWGCARSGPPAPVVYGSGGPGDSGNAAPTRSGGGSPAQDRGQRATGGAPDGGGADARSRPRQSRQAASDAGWARTGRAGLHTVAKGDTVYGLARRYQVPIRAIIDANDLEPPYTLYVGQEIRIPVPRRHVVERGDTVYGISRAYGVDMSELTRFNDIQPPYEITPGEVLVIPGHGREAAARRTAGPGDEAAGPSNREAENGAEAGTAGQGQNPRKDAAGTAVAGLPDAPAGTPTPPRAPARKTDGAGRADAADRQQARDTRPQVDAQPASAPQPKSIPKPPPRAEARFLWPVRGEILSGFGPMEGGLHNDGINVAAPAGTPVKAAENGVVAYVGNELRGFGNLLLLKHADGWVTAYAHTQEVLVRHGQQVQRGQIVARVGATGSVGRPQLHFEVRKGSEAKDPAQLLGSQQAAR